MARKASTNSQSSHGFGDIIGIALLAAALLLFVSQVSFDRNDLPANHVSTDSASHSTHNWIGPLGARVAYASFLVFGFSAYMLPLVLALYGLAYLFDALAYLKRRWMWAAILVLSCMGWLHLLDLPHLQDKTSLFSKARYAISAPSIGGFIGMTLYEYIFWMLGTVGAAIVYASLDLVSLLFLTNFQLGPWVRGLIGNKKEKGAEPSADEVALERRARELKKQAKQLEDEVVRATPNERSGLGPDLKPVPEPTVRDLSIPQSKGSRAKKPAPSDSVKDIVPAEEGEVIPAREVAAATTSDILGNKTEKASPESNGKTSELKTDETGTAAKPGEDEKSGEAKPEPEVKITGLTPKPRPRKKPITVASTPIIGNYQLPSMDFLQHPDPNLKPTESKEELMANARLMQQTLAQFDIEVSLGDITKGPTITRYELHPAPGVKLEKITALNNNIAAALKAERIHILAPVPGKSSVGVEVPNAVKTKVIMRDLLESEEWRNSKVRIPLALGKDVYGHPIISDLAEMPHLLIAGSTGSGKSVCINAIIASLLYRFSPDQLRFVMIDPKVVELQQYNALPHLVVPVVTDPKKVILALRWVVNEMEKRYQIFAKVGVRNIGTFNGRPKNKPIPQPELELPLMAKKEKVEPGAEGFAVEVDEEIVVPREDDIVIPEKLSYIVVIIDELADLMLVAPADVEMAIARITQMARAAGIHCIVATQRPSVDVITGVIKANIPARIAFQVAAKVDSRTILDAMGADKLLGKGDMLYLPPGSAKLIRAQGALITDQEIQSIVDFIAKQAKPSYEVEIHQQLSKPASSYEEGEGIDEDEEIIEQCIEVIRTEQKASVSLLQRRLRLGYGRAARIMDELENRGIVGPSKGAEPRDILIDLDGEGADGRPATGPVTQ
ncbi:MAG TPA: DNA translocase FtsK [Candidatus Dormibacteraeota bacterium]|nr:DNA translocase FtsK [Candidatus Dormibacteraeota bacterium]